MKCSVCGVDNPLGADVCVRCRAPIKPAKKNHSDETSTLTFTRSDMLSGSLLAGRYRIVEELGQGGMGVVVKARDEAIDDFVALKLLKSDVAADRRAVERFRNEAKFTRKISHKNVCRMYEFAKWKDVYFIVMEFISGEDLKSFLQRTGRLSIEQILAIGMQICRGLKAAHEFGVIHRDLKPSNIMIDEAGAVRVMDFGVARMRATTGLTSEGFSVGTPQYMAPEQVDGLEVDERSDIYSMGILLYEMAAGRVPFEGGTPFSIALRQKTARPVDPISFNRRIPERLDRIILKCLEKEREKRYQDADSLAADLSRVQQSPGLMKPIRFKEKRLRIKFSSLKMRMLWVLAPVLLMLLVGYLVRGRIFPVLGIGESEVVWKNSIAVLPFSDLSLNQDQAPVCMGMTDDLVTHLHRRFPDLKVIPSLSTERYLTTEKSIEEIGRELKVRTLMTGTLQIEQQQIRINVSLNSTESGSLIWSRRFQGEINGYFAVQDEIAESIGRELEVHLKTGQEYRKQPQPPFEAMRSYYKGRYHERIYRKSGNPEDFDHSLGFYEEASRNDGNYALFFWGLGNIFEARYAKQGKEEDLDQMLMHYQHAYKQDKDLAEANIALGWAHFYMQQNDRAYIYFLQAYRLDPYNPDINFQIGSFLRSVGLNRRAVWYYSQALAYDPMKPEILRLRARCYLNIAEYGSGVRDIQDAMEIAPDMLSYSLFHVRLLIMMGRYADAEMEIEKIRLEAPDTRGVEYIRALLDAVRGEKDLALTVIDKIENPVVMTYLLSSVHAVLGLHNEAIEDIRNGIQMGFQASKEYLYGYDYLDSNPFFDGLKQDPRFQEIIRQAKKRYDRMLIEYRQL